MDGKYTNKSAPQPPRCHSCARPMQLIRRTSRFGGLPDLYSFYCVACDEWHVEEGGPIKFGTACLSCANQRQTIRVFKQIGREAG